LPPRQISIEAMQIQPAGTHPDLIQLPEEGLDLEAYLESIRTQLMIQALERTDGVQTQASESLGMSFLLFRYYAKKAGLKGGLRGMKFCRPCLRAPFRVR
jgi:DNA-binding NtrC family response regulator